MKNILPLILSIFLSLIMIEAAATDYYSTGNGEAGNTATWNTKRDGSGSVPGNFNDPTDNFIIQTGHTISSSKAAFSFNGSLIIEQGGVFNCSRSSSILTAVAINPDGIFRLQQGSSLVAGFVLVQGKLENLGGKLHTGSAPLVKRH
jgi:hypothetical protein